MKKVFLLATLLVVSVAFAQQNPAGQGPSALNGGLVQSWANIPAGAANLGRHDLLNGSTGLPLGCETCHLPHTAPTYGQAFLWAWSQMPVVVMTYSTDNNPAGMLNPPGAIPGYRTGGTRSMLCLTCHDGTSANANGITNANIGGGAMPFPLVTSTGGAGDMSSQHPVHAIVPVTADFQPATQILVNGVQGYGMNSATYTIGANSLPLWDDARVECTSCHDQHNDYQSNQGASGGVPFLRVANTNGTFLCRQCHVK